MPATLPPPGAEALDGRDCDPALAERTLREIAVTNVLLGGHAAIGHGIRALRLRLESGDDLSVLDVGCGDGSAGLALSGNHRARGLRIVGIDHHATALSLSRDRGVRCVRGDMWKLPFSDRAFDVVLANLVLHHVPRSRAAALVASLDRLARLGVVIADLRRSALAAAGFPLLARLLRFHPVTRHDGTLSIRRGFTPGELRQIMNEAGVTHANIDRRPGWRLVASWRKRDVHA